MLRNSPRMNCAITWRLSGVTAMSIAKDPKHDVSQMSVSGLCTDYPVARWCGLLCFYFFESYSIIPNVALNHKQTLDDPHQRTLVLLLWHDCIGIAKISLLAHWNLEVVNTCPWNLVRGSCKHQDCMHNHHILNKRYNSIRSGGLVKCRNLPSNSWPTRKKRGHVSYTSRWMWF